MRDRRSNVRPVRGITADTVRALLALRHAGTDCSYLPLERTRLVDQVKGSAPAPCIDLADVPATLRADCDAYPAMPVVIGFDRGNEGSDRTVVSIRGKSGTVIIDEFSSFASPPGQKPAAKDDAKGVVSLTLQVPEAAPNLTPSASLPGTITGSDGVEPLPFPEGSAAPIVPLLDPNESSEDEARPTFSEVSAAPAIPAQLDNAERAYNASLAKEPRARREHDRAEQSTDDQVRRFADPEISNRPARRFHGSARSGTTARSACQDAERDAAAPVLKAQRIDLIRDIAARLDLHSQPTPRPIAAPRIERKPLSTLGPDPLAQRREDIARAIRFLKTRCILVDITDRTAAIRKYRVSGKRDTMLAEQVIEHARSLGMEPAHQ